MSCSTCSRATTSYDHVKREARHELPEEEGERRLPVVFWSRLSLDLEPYLTERLTEGASLIDVYHRELGDVAKEVYLAAGVAEERHAALAAYFRSKTDPQGDGTWTGSDTHGLSELPYHLAEAERLDDLFETLTNFRFLERKAAEVAVEHGSAEGGTTRTYTGVFSSRMTSSWPWRSSTRRGRRQEAADRNGGQPRR